MNYQILNLIGISTAFLLLFTCAEYLYHYKQKAVEKTRKLVHLGTGVLAMSFPFLFDSTNIVFALCSTFLLGLGLAKRFGYLQSINAVVRETSGSYWFPIAVLLCFYAQVHLDNTAFYYLPLLTLTLADPVACLIGKRFPLFTFQLKHSQKSIGGSAAFFIVAFGLANLFMGTGFQQSFSACVLFAGTTCIAEFFGSRGHDNISIPTAAIGALYYLQTPTLILC